MIFVLLFEVGELMSNGIKFSDNGYFGPGHRDASISRDRRELKAFIARFKHALLFTPKLLLADHMMFSANFQEAYKTDDSFKHLLRGDLVDLAHFEKFNNGRAFTLVECRKFYEYLRQGQDSRYDPRDPHCPADPFDDDLEVIQQNVGRLFPESAKRDPLFTDFVDAEMQQQALVNAFGELYTLYETAYDKLRSDCRDQNIPLGMIHFDEAHKVPKTENIFDYMSKISSLSTVPRERLVSEFGDVVARAHRTLLIKAEMTLLSGAHAILPSDLAPYRALAFSNLNAGTIDEKEATIREMKIDLSAINPETLATLTLKDVIEIRDAGQGFFEMVRSSSHKTECFDEIWNSLTTYCKHINRMLAFRDLAPSSSKRFISSIRLVQGKIARHAAIRDGGIATVFKVFTNVAHSLLTAQTGIVEVGGAADVSLQGAEHLAKKALSQKPLVDLVDDVKAKLVLSEGKNFERLMHYD